MKIPCGPWTPNSKETNTIKCLDPVQSCVGPRTGCPKQVKAMISSETWQSTLVPDDPLGQFILGYTSSGDHPIRNTEHSAVIPVRVSLVQLFVKVHNEKVEFSKSA